MPTIAIIGGGFSGTILAANLLREATTPITITLIERRREVGRGVAYSTSNARHLLNVPAGKMSAFPDTPNHFLEWLGNARADEFIPRQRYGDYLAHCLETAQTNSQANLEIIHAEAVGVCHSGEVATIDLGARSIKADHVVIAVGNFPPGHVDAFARLPEYRPDPWAANTLEGIKEISDVLLLGTGLTAIDLALAINEQNPAATIHMLSPAAELPAAWCPSTGTWPVELSGAKTIRDLTKLIRTEIAKAQDAGHSWEEVFDAIRGRTPALWKSLSPQDRRRFMTHVRRFFERYRHRIPPPTAQILQELQASGKLRLHRTTPDSFTPRTFTRVINCTGPACDYRRMTHPLVQSLLAAGHITPDPLGLGLASNETGALLNREGIAEGWLWSLGPPLKGALWETTAVPEIRMQAKALASVLLSDERTTSI